MKTKNTIFAILSILSICVGCEKDFEEINTKSFSPQNVNPGTLLPTVIADATNNLLRLSFNQNNELMQYTSINNTVDEIHWYNVNDNHSSAVWNFYDPLQDTLDMYRIAEENDNSNYMAIALTLKSLMFSYLTDVFVEIPYEEGLNAEEGILQPQFDAQELVYRGILTDLERANQLIVVDDGLDFGGDILYEGDMSKWKKFINSLRIRYYLRLSKRQEIDSGEKIREILANPEKFPVFEGNEDAAILKYSGVQPFVNPFSNDGPLTFELHSMGSTLIDLLKATDDPRIATYAEPIENSKNNGGELLYDGTPSGLPFSEITGTDASKSLVNFRFKAADQPGIIMPYYELQFLLAETAQKGIIVADAEGYYISGITSSFDFWDRPIPEGFLDQPEIKFNNSLEQIITQKWVALFFTGMESWFDYRRTGYPILNVGPGHTNDGVLPVRYPYPTSVQSLNRINYESAVSKIGGDGINIKGWWEKD